MRTEQRLKIGKSLMGKRDEQSRAWKGSRVGYVGLHLWVQRKLGKAYFCLFCNTQNAKKYEWANLSKKYKRVITDWIQLCTTCHQRFDRPNKWLFDAHKWWKRCSACKKLKIADENFYQRKTTRPNGQKQAAYTSWCKPCTQSKFKQYV